LLVISIRFDTLALGPRFSLLTCYTRICNFYLRWWTYQFHRNHYHMRIITTLHRCWARMCARIVSIFKGKRARFSNKGPDLVRGSRAEVPLWFTTRSDTLCYPHFNRGVQVFEKSIQNYISLQILKSKVSMHFLPSHPIHFCIVAILGLSR